MITNEYHKNGSLINLNDKAKDALLWSKIIHSALLRLLAMAYVHIISNF